MRKGEVIFPILSKDGIGGGMLPPDFMAGGRQGTVIVLYSDDAVRRSRVDRVLRSMRFDDVSWVTGQGAVGAVVPGLNPDVAFWEKMGLNPYSVRRNGRVVDPNNSAQVDRSVRKALGELGSVQPRDHTVEIGVNRFGQRVVETALGRRIEAGSQSHGEWEASSSGNRTKGEAHPDAFFRAVDQESFEACARNAVAMVSLGYKLSNSDLETIYNATGAGELGPEFDLEAFRESIEASLANFVVERRIAGRNASVAVTSRLPAYGERSGLKSSREQYSTPLPFGQAIAEILNPSPGARVYEPTIGNGLLVAEVVGRGADVVGVEIDAGRAERSKSALGSGASVIRGDVSQQYIDLTFDLVVANPPFAKLDRPEELVFREGDEAFVAKTLHHKIAFEALSKLVDDGRGALVLPADMVHPTELSGARRQFDNFLRMEFENVEAVACDARLFGTSGARAPVIVYGVGNRRDALLGFRELNALAPTELPYARSFDELFAWSDAVAEKWGIQAAGPNVRQTSSEERGPSGPQKGAGGASEGLAPEEVREAPEGAVGRPQGDSEPSGGPPDAHPVSEWIVDDIDADPFVRPYIPFSEVSEPRTAIQKTLQSSTYRALERVETLWGPVDQFVSSKLGIPVDVLGKKLSAEQVDGFALSLSRRSNGKGFLVGDRMGVGKGRFLAAHVLEAVQDGRPVIFMSEKPTLFSDFVARDIPDVFGVPAEELLGSGTLVPHVFNTSLDAHLRSFDGSVLHKSSAKLNREVRDNGLGLEVNLAMLTYSQFQTASGAWRLEALEDWALQMARSGTPPILLLDEAHKAAGVDSRTGLWTTQLMKTVWDDAHGDVVYSSATSMKSGKNVRLFEAALPDTGMSPSELTRLIEANPLALQEVLSTEMSMAGAMISREMDSAGVERRFTGLIDIDDELLGECRDKVDEAASFLGEMLRVAQDIKSVATDKVKEQFAGVVNSDAEKKVSVSTVSPASQFHAFSQYLVLSVRAAFAKTLVIDAIARGEKPVLVVENTAEAVTRWLMDEEGRPGNDATGGVELPHAPNIGDVLIRNAQSLLTFRFTDGLGGVHEDVLPEFEGWLDGFTSRVRETDFSLLRIDVIDRLKEICGDLELSHAEVTKRGLELKNEEGRLTAYARDPGNHQEAIRSFNNGATDVLIINRSASSGVSMHASLKTGRDLRRRAMIKLQMQGEITNERQIDGRIHRFDQVHAPRYVIPMSGFAADDRLCQIFNRHNRSLTATSTGTRENSSNISEAADLFNPVGEGVCRFYLSENPDIAEALDIPVANADSAEADPTHHSGVVRKLMGRLVCLGVDQQEAVLSEIDTLFQMQIAELSARGINPLALSEYDWKAKVEHISDLQEGDAEADMVSDRPVTLVRLHFKEKVIPYDSEALSRLVEQGREREVDREMHKRVVPREALGAFIGTDGVPDFKSWVFDRALNRLDSDRLIGMDPVSADAALEIWSRVRTALSQNSKLSLGDLGLSYAERRIIRAGEDALALNKLVAHMQAGAFVGFNPAVVGQAAETAFWEYASDQEGVLVPGIITSTRMNRTAPLALGQWHVNFVSPGEQNVRQTSLASIAGVAEASVDVDVSQAIMTGAAWLDEVDYAVMSGNADRVFDAVQADRLAGLYEGHREQLREIRMDRQSVISWDDPRIAPFLKEFLNTSPAGEVMKKRYALEGNLFTAVKLSQNGRRRLGEKAIYSDENGDIRHGIVLQATGAEKVRDLVETKANTSAQTLPNLISDDRITDLMEGYLSIVMQRSAYRQLADFSEFGQRRFADAVGGYTGGSDGERTAHSSAVFSRVSEYAAEVAGQMKSKAPPALIVGADPFESATEMSIADIKRGGERRRSKEGASIYFREEGSGFRLNVEAKAALVRTAAPSLGRDGAMVVLDTGGASLVFHKKNRIIEDVAPEMLQRASNALRTASGQVTLKGGMLAYRLAEPGALYRERLSDGAKILLEIANRQSEAISAAGPVLGFAQGAEKVAKELRACAQAPSNDNPGSDVKAELSL